MACLGRYSSIDAFIERTSWHVNRELAFVLFEHGNIMVGQSWNLVNVLDLINIIIMVARWIVR